MKVHATKIILKTGGKHYIQKSACAYIQEEAFVFAGRFLFGL